MSCLHKDKNHDAVLTENARCDSDTEEILFILGSVESHSDSDNGLLVE